MRYGLIPALMLAAAGLVSVAAAEEVKLNDQDRTEMRQRVDSLKSQNALGRSRSGDMRAGTMHDAKPMKVRHGKKHKKKHSRRSASKRHT